MSMGSRILEARTRKGLTQESLAEKIGVTKGAIANYENSVSFPKVDILFKLFDALDVDANFLYQDYATFADNSQLGEEELAILSDYRSISESGRRLIGVVLNEELRRAHEDVGHNPGPVSMVVYNFPAAAGIPLYVEDDSYERIEFSSSKVPKGADFGIRVSGDSMEPTIEAGAIVFVRKTAELRPGEIGIFMLDDEAVCKRFSADNNGFLLVSDNEAYEDVAVKGHQRFAIIGKVLGYK